MTSSYAASGVAQNINLLRVRAPPTYHPSLLLHTLAALVAQNRHYLFTILCAIRKRRASLCGACSLLAALSSARRLHRRGWRVCGLGWWLLGGNTSITLPWLST